MGLHWLGGEATRSDLATNLTLPMWSVSVSVVQGNASASPCVLGFS